MNETTFRPEHHASHADLLGRARALVPLLVRDADRAESQRRLTDEVLAALDDAGLLRILQPRRFGGFEADFRTAAAVTSELAKGCGSTAWLVAIMGNLNWIIGLGPDQLQRDIWGGNPRARSGGSFSTAGVTRIQHAEGGLRVTGKWPAASGCLHADWAALGVPIVDAEDQVIGRGLAFIPTRALRIEDSWFTAGMRATGSNTLLADDVMVPSHRILCVPDLIAGNHPTPYEDEILYRSRFIPVSASMLATVQIGLAERALELVIESAPKRAVAHTTYTSRTLAPSIQIAVARAAMLVDTAQFHARRVAEMIDAAAATGRKLAYLERARSRMEASYVVETARGAIRILCEANGTATFGDGPLQRIWRDSETAASHAALHPNVNAEIFGRALLGVSENISPLV
jgi:3-hydroxy-9,10-secoandrosta-1,3,5(10)-triene-9,17-dione monooxygenase